MAEMQFINLSSFSGRDDQFKLRYFQQFVDLVSQRIPQIEKARDLQDRELIWKALHGARPQLMFFGVPKVQAPMEAIESQLRGLSEAELLNHLNLIIDQMKGALEEMRVLTEQLQNQSAK